MLVFLSVYVMLSILLSILVCAAAPHVCSVLVWSMSRSLHHLQADGKVAFEDVPVIGVCRPACHDYSMYIFVLVLFLDAVVFLRCFCAY